MYSFSSFTASTPIGPTSFASPSVMFRYFSANLKKVLKKFEAFSEISFKAKANLW